MHLKEYSKAVTTKQGYGYLHQHSSRISIGIKNLTNGPPAIKGKTIVASVTTANVLPVLAPKVVGKSATVNTEDIDSKGNEPTEGKSTGQREMPKLLL